MKHMQRKSRDSAIELARLLGCMIVIGVHVGLNDYEGGVYDLSRGFINCLLADGVAIFWLITGCFLFRSNDYRKILIRTAKTIALPMAALQIFCLHFSDWIANGGNLLESIVQTPGMYLLRLKDALALVPAIPRTGHLWYCYAYILIMLAFPVLHAFVSWMDEDARREKWFCIITVIFMLLNDFSLNQMLQFSHHGLNAAVPAAIEVIWGHILYRHKDEILNLKNQRLCLVILTAGFLILNYIRMNIVAITDDKSILYWYSTIGLFCGISVISSCLIFCGMIRKNSAVNNFINGLAGYTFGIYLVHMEVRALLYRYDVHTKCLNWLSNYLDGMLLEIIYTLVLGALMFIISFCIVAIIKLILKLLQPLVCSLNKMKVGTP